MDITKRGALPEEASIHTTEMTAIKITMRGIEKKRRHEMGNIQRLASLMLPIENRENHPTLNQI